MNTHSCNWRTKNDAIDVFPNPTTGILNINVTDANSSIELFDVIGNRVYVNTLIKGNNIVDLSSLPNGSYFLKVNSKIAKVILSK